MTTLSLTAKKRTIITRDSQLAFLSKVHNTHLRFSFLKPEKTQKIQKIHLLRLSSQVSTTLCLWYYTIIMSQAKWLIIIWYSSQEQQSGAVEACWAHNPEVRRSKLRSAIIFSTLQCLLVTKLMKPENIIKVNTYVLCRKQSVNKKQSYRGSMDLSNHSSTELLATYPSTQNMQGQRVSQQSHVIFSIAHQNTSTSIERTIIS